MFQKNTSPVSYYQNKNLIIEHNPTFDSLCLLYGNFWGKLLRNIIARRWFAKLIGKYKDSKHSKRLIKPFIKEYNIDMNEYVIPTAGYKTFNQFFIRSLKPGARPIAREQHLIVSPGDAKLYVILNISTDRLFFVKHSPFNLEKFLGDATLADYYRNGTLLIFRLAPYDYHRFHFPVDCTPSAPATIKGIFESVNPIVYKNGVQPLLENERHLITLQTDAFGTVAMIPVGATMVGKIVETYKANTFHKKGDECGYFAFGGSTVVLLFKQGSINIQEQFLAHSLQGYETAVKMGEPINF